MGDDRAALERAIAATEHDRVDLLRRLVRTPSVTGTEGAVQELVSAAFREAGLEVHVQEVDAARVAPHLREGTDRDFRGRPNVIGRLPGRGGGRSLLLNAHVDTVTPGDEARWRFGPFSGEVADGCVWGRGACDMKAGLVASLHAALALQEAGVELAGDLLLAATIAEESGGAGAIACALDWPADAAIVTEPTRLAVAPAHAGASHVRIELEGLSAHSCVRDAGVSAVEKFVALHAELLAYERERNADVTHPLFRTIEKPAPLNVGVVAGGEWYAMVPEQARIEARLGFLPGEDFDAIRTAFQERIAAWAAADPWLAAHPPAVEFAGAQFPPAEIPTDSPLVETVTAAFSDATATRARIAGMTFGADMQHFIAVGGMPALLFGPGDIARAHKVDECVPLADVHVATAVLAHAAYRWCGHGSV